MNVFIYPNLQKENAYNCTLKVIDILFKQGFKLYIEECYKETFGNCDNLNYINYNEVASEIEYAVAIGGDGTILHCSKLIRKYDTRLVGINTGRLGFMSSVEADDLDLLKNLRTNQFNISKRMMLKGTIDTEKKMHALNDIVIYESKSKMCEFVVKSNNVLVGKYRSNGIILSTPTGSTAYALSAGGPILHPELNCIELSLICPHSLFARPLIFSSESTIEITAITRPDQKILVNCDGDESINFDSNSKLKISKSMYSLEIVDFNGSTFFETLNKKLMHPIK